MSNFGLWLLVAHVSFVPVAFALRGLRIAGGSGWALRQFGLYSVIGTFALISFFIWAPGEFAPVEAPRFMREVATASSGEAVRPAPVTPTLNAPRAVFPADPWRPLAWGLLAISGFGLAMQLMRLARERRRLQREVRAHFEFKKWGDTRIVFSDRTDIPYVYAEGARGIRVVLPQELAAKPRELKLSLAHELQHVRHRDPWWQWGIALLDGAFTWNPAYRVWRAETIAAQEFACDEALLTRQGIDVFNYGRCLLQAAERALGLERKPECAPGFLGGAREPQLKQRMNRMFQPPKTKRWIFAAMGTALAITLGATSLIARAGLKDRRVTQAEAKAWAASLDLTPGFKLNVNTSVVEELNRILGDSRQRTKMRDTLERMRTYQPMIEKEVLARRLPPELMAVPIVESGYQNLKQSPRGPWGAGLWQFIPQTARNFGLRVDSTLDERLDERKLTDAAFRYLTANQQRFQDWELALLAYNVGESRVQQGIEKVGSRDAWTLIDRGYEGDSRYLAKVMAAVMVLGRPEVLD